MKDKIIKLYSNLGIDCYTNKLLLEFIELLNEPDDLLKKQYEFFHQDFILSLNEIKKNDKKSFEKYVKRINDTKGKLNFWGEKFEIYNHSQLIKLNANIIFNLRRGREGKEPDFLFNYNKTELGIELTSLKFIESPKNEEIIINKITDCIIEKNNKPYSNEKTALIIDVTNMIAYEKLNNYSLKSIFKKHFEGFEYLQKEMRLGFIILCFFDLKEFKNNELIHSLNPLFGLQYEKKPINKDLISFLRIIFNNFEQDKNFIRSFHHQNI